MDPNEEDLSLEIQRFSLHALELAKRTVEQTITEQQRAEARELEGRLPGLAERSKRLEEATRANANRALADARLDLAYVAAGGGIPSSIRLGRYLIERELS